MRTRIRLILPPVQVVLAIILIVSNRLREQWGSRPAFLAPDLQFCGALNAPATVIWSLLLRLMGIWYWAPLWIEEIVQKLAYLVLIGLLWYAVSIEIGGGGQSVLTSKVRMRSAVDVLLMAFAGCVGASAWLIRSHEFGFVTTYSTLVATPYFLWAVVIAAFYGRDLRLCLRRKRVDSQDMAS